MGALMFHGIAFSLSKSWRNFPKASHFPTWTSSWVWAWGPTIWDHLWQQPHPFWDLCPRPGHKKNLSKARDLCPGFKPCGNKELGCGWLSTAGLLGAEDPYFPAVSFQDSGNIGSKMRMWSSNMSERKLSHRQKMSYTPGTHRSTGSWSCVPCSLGWAHLWKISINGGTLAVGVFGDPQLPGHKPVPQRYHCGPRPHVFVAHKVFIE